MTLGPVDIMPASGLYRKGSRRGRTIMLRKKKGLSSILVRLSGQSTILDSQRGRSFKIRLPKYRRAMLHSDTALGKSPRYPPVTFQKFAFRIA